MKMQNIIVKKRDGKELDRSEIGFFVNGYSDGRIPDYQAAAFLMAVWFRGMNSRETSDLTNAMMNSGDVADLKEIKGIKVDKHSTGGVGDKTSLIACPIVAACGVPVAKMSGRGLGFTGGTIDKLASIPGFRTTLGRDEFVAQVNEEGIALIGQSGMITPADKKIYALRDVTGTVENKSLIASSIMSKKLAAGSDAIVLDAKVGSGAFMKNLEDAEELGQLMCEIGNAAGRKTIAVVTDMDQPLGCAVGNALEVEEAIMTLNGHGPEDITELSTYLAGLMLCLGGRARSTREGLMMAQQALSSGAALERFRKLVIRQGGDPVVVDDPSRLPRARYSADVKAKTNGFIQSIDAQVIGEAAGMTGTGREKMEDEIDPGAGILLHKKTGSRVKKNDVIATVYGRSGKIAKAAADMAAKAFVVRKDRPEPHALIRKTIGLEP